MVEISLAHLIALIRFETCEVDSKEASKWLVIVSNFGTQKMTRKCEDKMMNIAFNRPNSAKKSLDLH